MSTKRNASCVQQVARTDRDDGGGGAGEIVGIIGGDQHRGREAVGFARNGRVDQRLLAREVPVDGGACATRLATDVVERGLGDPHPADARERRIDDLMLHQMRHYADECLIVNVSQVTLRASSPSTGVSGRE